MCFNAWHYINIEDSITTYYYTERSRAFFGNPGSTIFKSGISGTSIIIVGISKLDINILPGLRDDTFIFRKSGLSKYKFGISESDPLLLLPFHTVVFLKFDLPVIIFKSSVKKIYDRFHFMERLKPWLSPFYGCVVVITM